MTLREYSIRWYRAGAEQEGVVENKRGKQLEQTAFITVKPKKPFILDYRPSAKK
jgi:hypothetical protein